MESPSELNAKSESEKSNAQVSEPLALTDDGMKALVLAGCLERTRQIIDAGTTAGQIEKEHLDFLEGLMRFCANAVREDLGPGSPHYLQERYEFLQSDLSSLKRSFNKMTESVEAIGP